MIEFICTRCDICNINNHHPLRGDGNINASIMFVARNPSTLEVKKDIPLISKEGMLFQEFLDMFNFSRDSIFITNAVKCRTPGHRYPTDNEIYNCREHLENEINNINPKIIVLMGITAFRSYFKLAYTTTGLDYDRLNGKYIPHNGRVILFMVDPINALRYTEAKTALYNSFTTLMHLYRVINPAYKPNFNI